MRNPRVYRWNLTQDTIGLLFLAQRIEEALHDYTLDTYKAPALNTYTRCQELLRIIQDVRNGTLVAKTLVPAVEELSSSIRQDSAASSLCGASASKMSQVSWWNHDNIRQLAARAEFLKSRLWKRAYERELRRQLLSLVPLGREKQRIEHLSLSLVVEWMRLGFSRDYIYYRTRAYFFGFGKFDSNSHEALETFFGLFEAKRSKFDVCIRATSSVTALEPLLPSDLATIHREAPLARAGKPKEVSFLGRDNSGVFVVLPGIEALDARSARDEAVRRFQNISTLTYYHVHRTPMQWEGEALVWEGDHPTVLREARSPVHKEDECSSEALPRKVQSTINALNPNRLPTESWIRLRSALNLHASAVTTGDVMVQLTTLWSAIEALVPATGEDARIATIADVTVPMLSAHYPRKLFTDLDAALRKCIGARYRATLEAISFDGPSWLRCAEWAICDDHQAARSAVLGDLDRNPLLRFRVFALQKRFATAERALETIEDHRRRVVWHLRRIYRARNVMVHSGATMPYREALVENLHSYFHTIVNAVEAAFGSSVPPTGLDAAYLAERILFDAHLERLRQMGAERISASNLDSCLRGDIQ